MILVFLLLFSGCIDQINQQLKASSDAYKNLGIAENVSVQYDKNTLINVLKEAKKQYESRENGSVYTLVCNYSKLKKVGWDKFKAYWKFLLGDKKALFDESLIGGECWIQNVSHYPSIEAIIVSPYLSVSEIKKNQAFYKVIMEDDGRVYIEDISKLSDQEIEKRYKLFHRFLFFGIGSGPSFSDFNELNPFCNNSLRYPIKYISGTKTQYLLPALPDIRAACYLDLGYIPVYVFYSKYGIPEVDNSALLVARLSGEAYGNQGHVGPVILFTEASITPDELLQGLDVNSNTPVAGRIKAQVVSWKILCPSCLIGLSIPFDVKHQHLKKLKDIILSDSFLYENVSIIGFGLDVDKLDNKDSVAELIYRMDSLIRFSRDLGKPSAITYMYIPQSWLEKKIRPDGYKYSNFDYIMKTIYSTEGIGTMALSQMTGKGLMMLPSPPLIPESMIILLGKNNPISVLTSGFDKNEQVFSYTLSYCKEYFKVDQGLPVIYSSSGVDLLGISLASRTSYFKDTPDYREPIYNPPKIYDINDKDDVVFKCVGCFLMLNSSQIKNYKNIFNTARYTKGCNEPDENIVKKIKFYSDIIDMDPPFIRALIDELTNYNPNHVSFAKDAKEQMERCGHNLTYDAVKSMLPNTPKISDYVCGFGIMDVKLDITKEIISPCENSNNILGKRIFEIDINMCKGILLLANASDQAEQLIKQYSKYMAKDLEDRYMIYRMMLTALIYDQGRNFTEATVSYFNGINNDGLVDQIKTVGLTGQKNEDDKKCEDYMSLDKFFQYCCYYDGNRYEMINGYCKKIADYENYWDFLLGMKLARGFMYSSNPDYFISFKEAYLKVEKTLNITSKYFDVYEKCKDCADENWADNVNRKIKQICGNLPNLPMCK